MAQPLKVSLPPGIDLWDACSIRVTAIDPTTGATAAGVQVQNVTLQVTGTTVSLEQTQTGQWRLVPGPGA